MKVSVPANWQQLGGKGQTVTYAPQGAVFQRPMHVRLLRRAG